MKPYGMELILDIHNGDPTLYNRKDLKMFLVGCCELIDMERADLHWWDYTGDPEGYEQAPIHLKGTSAVQFITTSNITIHTLDMTGSIYLNVFSCKMFNADVLARWIEDQFRGEIVAQTVLRRM